jgi:nitrate/TMAO reductase-like tetraheme cytochrome c subunit
MQVTKSGEKDERTTAPSANGRKPGSASKKASRRSRWPKLHLDLSRPQHRLYLLLTMFGMTTLGMILLIGGYKSYVYTESAEFCGTTCHPMEPQFARYRRSPHASVACVDCHVGPGLHYFIESKINGLEQVHALVTDSFDRPIASPVKDLRPARETCETCHAPTSFKDNVIKTISHYDNDRSNTLIQSTLILKMGGWQESTGMSQGIHWHIANPVYYIAADDERQVIQWVGVEQPDGSLKEFFTRDMLLARPDTFVEEARQQDRVREMDCIDCHNRTAHRIPAPEEMVDSAIHDGLISRAIPSIRSKAVEILSANYTSELEAGQAIDDLVDYYAGASPALSATQRADLDQALKQVRQIYTTTNFPEMNLSWRSYPDNESHWSSLGCFRCHDGKHINVDESGREVEAISASCNLCHTVPILGRGDDLLVEAPVIVGAAPASHSDFSWTIEHRNINKADEQDCYLCHGQGFCNNGICHNLSHPPDMLYSHAEAIRQQGEESCYTCHQNIHCSQCHPDGVINNP